MDFLLCDFPVNSKTFAGLNNLKFLRMTYINWSKDLSIPTDTFRHLVNLRELKFKHNKTNDAIDPKMFSYLPKLETLDLSLNSFKISSSLLVHLTELKNLIVNENQVGKDVEEVLRKSFKLTILSF